MRGTMHKWFNHPRVRGFVDQSMRVSALLFAASLALPAFYFAGGGWIWGWYALLIGVLGYLGAHFAWFANVFYGVAGLFLRRGKPGPAVVWSLFALLLALSFMFYDAFDWEGRQDILHWGPGYYVWLCAIVVQMVGAYGRHVLSRET